MEQEDPRHSVACRRDELRPTKIKQLIVGTSSNTIDVCFFCQADICLSFLAWKVRGILFETLDRLGISDRCLKKSCFPALKIGVDRYLLQTANTR